MPALRAHNLCCLEIMSVFAAERVIGAVFAYYITCAIILYSHIAIDFDIDGHF